MVQVKRIYDAPGNNDGFRVLVDRLWPRGISKEQAALDVWLKEIAPSPELRIWFNHDPAKLQEFIKRYRSELAQNPAVAELLQMIEQHGTVSLLYASKDPVNNHAIVLQQFIQDKE